MYLYVVMRTHEDRKTQSQRCSEPPTAHLKLSLPQRFHSFMSSWLGLAQQARFMGMGGDGVRGAGGV